MKTNGKSLTRRAFFESPARRLQSLFVEEKAKTNASPSMSPVEEAFNPTMPGFAMYSDFSCEQLHYEIMRMGLDPSNMNEETMREILYEQMSRADKMPESDVED